MTQPLVALRGVTCRFGDVCAVDGLDLDVAQGETVGLIGPNGSGKSTTLGLVAGTLRPTAGTIRLAGADVTRMPAWRRVALGIAWTSQQPRVFERLSVRDNLAAAGRDAADAALHDAVLAHRRHALAATLTFAERRRLELARALALRPRVLLVDEPASGLDADELATLRERLAALRARRRDRAGRAPGRLRRAARRAHRRARTRPRARGRHARARARRPGRVPRVSRRASRRASRRHTGPATRLRGGLT
nr:ATP-binding cassette domain-containing protein [Burkholderia ubonensis]